eukprot:m.226672 g.226672  ORF g.226672 m.226672 type:complete len:427 (-) comp17008_c0_seq1:30-1310(-)
MNYLRRLMIRDPKLYNIVVHGIAFMGLFTAFQTSSSFQTTVLKDVGLGSNLGYTSLAIIYAVFSVANFISPYIVDFLGPRVGMGIGGAFYCLFIATFLAPKEGTVLGASGLLGVAAAVLWTAQGNFQTINSDDTTRGRNAGIFWALLQSSNLIGSTMAYLVLPDDNSISESQAHQFYLILFCVACGGIGVLFFTRPVQPVHSSGSSEPATKMGLVQSIKSTIDLLLTREMLHLVLIIAYNGLEQGFWGGRYPTALGNSDHSLPAIFKPKVIALHGIMIGVSQIIGGLAIGRVSDKFGKSWVVMIGLACHMCSYYAIFINLLSGYMEPSLPLALVCSFGLGLGDSCINTATYAILTERYSDRSLQAFAIFKCFQSAASGAAFGYSDGLALEYQLLLLGISAIIGAIFFVRIDAPRRHAHGAEYTPIA